MPMIRTAMQRAGLDWSILPAGRITSSAVNSATELLKEIEDKQIEIEELEEKHGHYAAVSGKL